MSSTIDQAAEALRDVEAVRRHSAVLRGYERCAPHLVLWGGLWAIGYTAQYFARHWPGGVAIWPVIWLVGGAAGFLLTRRDGAGGAASRRGFAIAVALFVFIAATVAVMAPRNPQQVGAFVPLVVALAYVLLGIFQGPRFVVTGMALCGLTLVGYFGFPSVFPLWMAVVGGSALALGGLWLRKA